MKPVLPIIILCILAVYCIRKNDTAISDNFAECRLSGPVELDSTLTSTGDLYGKYILTLSNAVDTFYYGTDLEDSTAYHPFSHMHIRIVSKDSVVRTVGIIDRLNLKTCRIVPGKKYNFHFMFPLMEHLHADSMYFYFRYGKKPDIFEDQQSFEVGMKVDKDFREAIRNFPQ